MSLRRILTLDPVLIPEVIPGFVEARLESQVSALGVITSRNFSEKPHNPDQHGPNTPLPPPECHAIHTVGESCPGPPPRRMVAGANLTRDCWWWFHQLPRRMGRWGGGGANLQFLLISRGKIVQKEALKNSRFFWLWKTFSCYLILVLREIPAQH